MKTLSICIPVFNRRKIFELSLLSVCEEVAKNSKQVNIIISDNDSTEDIKSLIDIYREKYKTIEILYFKQDKNYGGAINYLKTISMSSSEYCWVIGSDDFIMKDSISKILKKIFENPNVDFFSLNYDLIFIENLIKKNIKSYKDLILELNKNKFKNKSKGYKFIDEQKEFNLLIDKKYNNTYLGAIMTGIFRRKLLKFDIREEKLWFGFDKLSNIYPHCYLYGKNLMGKIGYFISESLIIVGEGTREWSTDNGKNFWESHLPLIYIKIYKDMITHYHDHGLNNYHYYRLKSAIAYIAGKYFINGIYRKRISKIGFLNQEKIKFRKIFSFYAFTLSFYIGIVNYITKWFIHNLRRIIK